MDLPDKVSHQMQTRKYYDPPYYEPIRTSHGAIVGHKTDSLTAGPRGPLLMQDFVFLDEMAHFNRERIPERVVHAKGAGAKGYFEVTHDITQYTRAVVFSSIGEKTDVAVRFSTVIGEKGSGDTERDPRGFAVKFYTVHGNWDLVGNNTPIFFIRDPILFPSFVHSQKRNPNTHCKDADMFWDFITLRPETFHQVLFYFSDRGIPDGYRHMNGYGSHTFKLVNSNDEEFYCKFHFKTDQGIKNLSPEEAKRLLADDPDYATRDLYNAIANRRLPSWTLHIQVMTLEEAESLEWNPFDVTKVWPHKDYPLIPVGKLVLNQNLDNYFNNVEQLAFSPAHLIPGIQASPDKMLQGRLFAYSDAQRYRLGTNYHEIPVNCPYKSMPDNYQRDGTHSMNKATNPNYFPNSFDGPKQSVLPNEAPINLKGEQAKRYDTEDEDNFSQAQIFYQKVLNDEERERLAQNIAGHLQNAQSFLQQRAFGTFRDIDPALEEAIQKHM